MAGYFIHMSSAPEDIRTSVIGLKGVIAPDLWKKNTPTYEEYKAFFEGCLCSDIPSYDQVKLLCSTQHGGTHYGSSSTDTDHADFTLLAKQLNSGLFDYSLFFKGYTHHLYLDKKFYSNESICNQAKFGTEFAVDPVSAKEKLYNDWNKTNASIAEWYPEIIDLIDIIPENIKHIIRFTEGEPTYIALTQIKLFIEDMRKPRSIEDLLSFKK